VVERHPCPRCRVIFTVNEMKRLGRDAAELAETGGAGI
jgi:hypothetical protein